MLRPFIVAAIVAGAAVPPSSAGAQNPGYADLACARSLDATAAGAGVVLHLTGDEPMVGTVRLYGREHQWTAAISGSQPAKNARRVDEQLALVRTAGAVLGVQFTPREATCSMIVPVRPRSARDADDPTTGVDARDAGALAPPTCERPFAAPIVLRAVEPNTPAFAQQQGINGTVVIGVLLDADSRVVRAFVAHSPSAILNQASLAAARASTYRTAVVACEPVASATTFTVDFSSR